MKIIKNSAGFLDCRQTMYPCYAEKIHDSNKIVEPYSTVYGYVFQGQVILPNNWAVSEGEYFSYSAKKNENLSISGSAFLIVRLGYIGQNNLGGPVEESGRLCYIDGCSDSLLIYPPRQGDPSLNLLYFPTNVEQSFHIHPSLRLGAVIKGNGVSCLADKEIKLNTGDVFCIEEREYHRFSTKNNSMTVVAFHPDGDWGPTDHNHSMLNRTYLSK